MIEPFQDEQEKAATAAEIEDPFWRDAMKFQILNPLAIDPQPLIDIGVFCVARISVAILNFEEPILVDPGEHRPKWEPKYRTLGPAPAPAISFAAPKLGEFPMQLHASAVAISRSNPGPR